MLYSRIIQVWILLGGFNGWLGWEFGEKNSEEAITYLPKLCVCVCTMSNISVKNIRCTSIGYVIIAQ
jgi:hypothetical protein